MSALFQPLQIRGLKLKNRIVVSPMCQYSSVDGFANDWHLVHLGARAIGGAALIIQEASAVTPEGRITPDDLGIWKDEHIPFLKRITSFIEAQGSIPGIQLAHAGRKASHHSPWKGGESLAPDQGAWTTLAPSAIAFKEGEPVPHEMTLGEIRQLIDDFREAAKRALKAGYKMIELHGAHGYLLHEFYSPLSNKRTDEYGGSFENRIRLLKDLSGAVREVVPDDFPLWMRISATDWIEGGWNEQDSVVLAKELKAVGVDLIDCSTGGNITGVKIPLVPLYQTPFAETIRREAGIMTGAVGLINTPQEAESIIAEGRADVVILARQMLRDPNFALRAAHDLGVDIDWPVQYDRAKKNFQ
jgi:2,4-dienoyl-CoA reductase-like NADH-dependent reductase (Old Yellow Enzyme family)